MVQVVMVQVVMVQVVTVRAVIVERENGTAIEVLGGNPAVTMVAGRLVETVTPTPMTAVAAAAAVVVVVVVVVVTDVVIVVVETAMRISLHKTDVDAVHRRRRSESLLQILPTSYLSSSGSVA
jgi:hypothetical protein